MCWWICFLCRHTKWRQLFFVANGRLFPHDLGKGLKAGGSGGVSLLFKQHTGKQITQINILGNQNVSPTSAPSLSAYFLPIPPYKNDCYLEQRPQLHRPLGVAICYRMHTALLAFKAYFLVWKLGERRPALPERPRQSIRERNRATQWDSHRGLKSVTLAVRTGSIWDPAGSRLSLHPSYYGLLVFSAL